LFSAELHFIQKEKNARIVYDGFEAARRYLPASEKLLTIRFMACTSLCKYMKMHSSNLGAPLKKISTKAGKWFLVSFINRDHSSFLVSRRQGNYGRILFSRIN